MTELEKKVNEMYEWFQARKVQQLSYPVDEASKNAISAVQKFGVGSSDLTDTVIVGPGGATFDVPKAYAGSIVVSVDGENYEIGYL